MTKYKTIKARKNHKCTICDETILKGERYEYMEGREPTFVTDGMGNCFQDGIEYVKIKMCLTCDKELSQWPHYSDQ